jgi:hypothetical protein
MQPNVLTHILAAQLTAAVNQLTPEVYLTPSINLSGATIGQHLRHIVELLQCLEEGYEAGLVNYEKRRRDVRIETDKDFALACMATAIENSHKEDKPMMMEAALGTGEQIRVSSSYQRELIYNMEHIIHHMALMRVGIKELTTIMLPESFGVAPSTIEYRRQCAQ